MESTNTRPATYQQMRRALGNLLGDLEILAGNNMGPNEASWQDVAGTAAVSAGVLINQLLKASQGNCESGITFPSPSEELETLAR